MFSRSLPGLLPALRLPALVVHSSEDRIVPRSVSERYAALLSGSHLVDLAGAGHQGDLESPSGLANEVKSFLS
jgi:pimeloyl-ACP methyl ester carboxylesterase